MPEHAKAHKNTANGRITSKNRAVCARVATFYTSVPLFKGVVNQSAKWQHLRGGGHQLGECTVDVAAVAGNGGTDAGDLNMV